MLKELIKMATKNIQINVKTSSGYDQLYPQVNLINITGVLPVSNGGTGVNNLNSLKTSLGLSNIGEYTWTQICNQTTSVVFPNRNNYNIPINSVLSNYNAFIIKISNLNVSATGQSGYAGTLGIGTIYSSTSNFSANFSGQTNIFTFQFNSDINGVYDLSNQVFILTAFNTYKTSGLHDEYINQIYSKEITGPGIKINMGTSDNFNQIVGYIGFNLSLSHLSTWSVSANLIIYGGMAKF